MMSSWVYFSFYLGALYIRRACRGGEYRLKSGEVVYVPEEHEKK
jgi:hypothetical protein